MLEPGNCVKPRYSGSEAPTAQKCPTWFSASGKRSSTRLCSFLKATLMVWGHFPREPTMDSMMSRRYPFSTSKLLSRIWASDKEPLKEIRLRQMWGGEEHMHYSQIYMSISAPPINPHASARWLLWFHGKGGTQNILVLACGHCTLLHRPFHSVLHFYSIRPRRV